MQTKTFICSLAGFNSDVLRVQNCYLSLIKKCLDDNYWPIRENNPGLQKVAKIVGRKNILRFFQKSVNFV